MNQKEHISPDIKNKFWVWFISIPLMLFIPYVLRLLVFFVVTEDNMNYEFILKTGEIVGIGMALSVATILNFSQVEEKDKYTYIKLILFLAFLLVGIKGIALFGESPLSINVAAIKLFFIALICCFILLILSFKGYNIKK